MHWVTGSYGPHTGQPRAGGAPSGAPMSARAPVSARGQQAGPRLGALGGIADQDDVDGILQQVRHDVRSIQQGSRQRELDGRWFVKGHAVQIVINDGAVMALGGEPQLITWEGPGKFYIDDQGSRVDGTLVGTEIIWSDGDVWIAMQDGLQAGSSGGRPVAKSLSRNMSDATWDRPRTMEAKDAQPPRAQPKATVRGNYVFSGGAESQVLTGPHDRSRQASADFVDDLTSKYIPQKPGNQRPHLAGSASHRQLQAREQLPPQPETPDCTDI